MSLLESGESVFVFFGSKAKAKIFYDAVESKAAGSLLITSETVATDKRAAELLDGDGKGEYQLIVATSAICRAADFQEFGRHVIIIDDNIDITGDDYFQAARRFRNAKSINYSSVTRTARMLSYENLSQRIINNTNRAWQQTEINANEMTACLELVPVTVKCQYNTQLLKKRHVESYRHAATLDGGAFIDGEKTEAAVYAKLFGGVSDAKNRMETLENIERQLKTRLISFKRAAEIRSLAANVRSKKERAQLELFDELVAAGSLEKLAAWLKTGLNVKTRRRMLGKVGARLYGAKVHSYPAACRQGETNNQLLFAILRGVDQNKKLPTRLGARQLNKFFGVIDNAKKAAIATAARPYQAALLRNLSINYELYYDADGNFKAGMFMTNLLASYGLNLVSFKRIGPRNTRERLYRIDEQVERLRMRAYVNKAKYFKYGHKGNIYDLPARAGHGVGVHSKLQYAYIALAGRLDKNITDYDSFCKVLAQKRAAYRESLGLLQKTLKERGGTEQSSAG